MKDVFIVGIDPGPTPGIATLHLAWWVGHQRQPTLITTGRHIVQCSDHSLVLVLDGLTAGRNYTIHIVAEAFVVGSLAGRVAHPRGGQAARAVLDLVKTFARMHGYTCTTRPAGAVKPWATDTRLAAAGLFDATKGMRHARDAARHALFAAVRDYGLRDPLSRGAA